MKETSLHEICEWKITTWRLFYYVFLQNFTYLLKEAYGSVPSHTHTLCCALRAALFCIAFWENRMRQPEGYTFYTLQALSFLLLDLAFPPHCSEFLPTINLLNFSPHQSGLQLLWSTISEVKARAEGHVRVFLLQPYAGVLLNAGEFHSADLYRPT